MIEIRQLTLQSELVEAVKLQKLIWGFDDVDLLPVRLFVTATKIGGHAFGAFDGGEMVGFCLAIPGIKPGTQPSTYLHSHMLGVKKEYRNSGLGRSLKLAQREDAMARNIALMEWTFDPLEIKNAYFNIERLGAIVRRFVLNQYGFTTSPLQAGLPTDRCTAEWWMSSPRVDAVLSAATRTRPEITARISIPNTIYELKANDPAQAREIQTRVSEQFLEHFSNGLAVLGFERSDEFGSYLVGPLTENPWELK